MWTVVELLVLCSALLCCLLKQWRRSLYKTNCRFCSQTTLGTTSYTRSFQKHDVLLVKQSQSEGFKVKCSFSSPQKKRAHWSSDYQMVQSYNFSCTEFLPKLNSSKHTTIVVSDRYIFYDKFWCKNFNSFTERLSSYQLTFITFQKKW